MRNRLLLIAVIVLAVAGVAVVGFSLSDRAGTSSQTTSTPSYASSYSTVLTTGTVTCYADGCVPLACPSWGCGPIVTTTVSGFLYFTRGTVTLNGTIKIMPGAPSGVYFFDVHSIQYRLVFCNCTGTTTAPCNCPNIPALTNGEQLRVTGTLVTPSTYGPVWAPGGDIYVQSWTAT